MLPTRVYSALPTSPEDATSSEGDRNDPRDASAQRTHNRLFLLTCVATICTSCLAFAVFAAGPVLVLGTSAYWSSPAKPGLRRPSTYMNMEKILRNKTQQRFGPVISSSHLMLQIATSDPLRSFQSEDHRSYFSNEGLVYPDDRHFIVSPVISSVMQFRNIDYGFERCVLRVAIPERTEKLEPAIQIDNTSLVDVWALDSSVELSRYIIWDRAPPRRTLFATFSFSTSEQLSTEFHCASASFSTFEFACSPKTPHCNVDFWQDNGNGIYMLQHDSVADQ